MKNNPKLQYCDEENNQLFYGGSLAFADLVNISKALKLERDDKSPETSPTYFSNDGGIVLTIAGLTIDKIDKVNTVTKLTEIGYL